MRPLLHAAATVLVLASPALGHGPFLPLATGNTWTYFSDYGEETTEIIGQTDQFGPQVWVKEVLVSPENEGLQNMWTSSTEDGVFLHGFWRGWGYFYDPPIKVADADMTLGDTWSTTVDFYTLPDMTYAETHTLSFEVYEEGIVAVPAGEFLAYGVGGALPPVLERDGATYTLSGERRRPGSRNADSWWSLGVGEVQYSGYGFNVLHSYAVQTVPTESRNWSDVKALFD